MEFADIKITRSEIVPSNMAITISDVALKEVRAFPVSRHRSARIRKKLIKRHGYEAKMQPCVIRFGDMMVVHPTIGAELNRTLQARIDKTVMDIFTGKFP